MRNSSFVIALAGAAALSATAGRALGQADRTAEWVSPDSGLWSDVERWLVDGEAGTGLFPQNGAETWDARITASTKDFYTVTLDLDVELTSFELSSFSALLDVGENTFTVRQDARVRFGQIFGSGGEIVVGDGSQFSDTVVDGVDVRAEGVVEFAGGTSFLNGVVSVTEPVSAARGSTSRLVFSAMAPEGGNEDDSIDLCNSCVDSRTGGSLGFGGSGTLNLEEGSEIINGTGSTFDLFGAGGGSISSSDGTGTVQNDGEIVRADPSRGAPQGDIRISNVDFVNNGLVRVLNASLTIDANNLLTDGFLRGGAYRVENSGSLSVVNSNTGIFLIVGLDADVTLSGSDSTFSELSTLAIIGDQGGRLRVENGRDFAAQSGFLVQGELSIGADSAFSAFQGLGNIIPVMVGQGFETTLRDGTFVIEGQLLTDSPDIDVIDADVTLVGESSQFSAIDNARAVGSQGRFALEGGRGFFRDGAFTVRDGGTLRVGEGSVFQVGFLTNFSETFGFDDAMFDIAGTLVAGNAAVREINNTVILDGVGSQIINDRGEDAFLGLERIGPMGTLVLRNGRTLAGLGDVIIDGTLVVEPGDAAGRAEESASQFTAGSIFVTDTATIDLLIAGDTPGSFGAVFADGLLALGDDDDGGPSLVLRFAPGYDAQLGDSFELLRAGSLVGEFDRVVVFGLEGLSIDLFYAGDALIASVVPSPATFGVLAAAGLTATRRRRR